MHPDESLALATAAAVGHYDALRIDNTERTARHGAESYLRRKTHLTALAATETLGAALAMRASFGMATLRRVTDMVM